MKHLFIAISLSVKRIAIIFLHHHQALVLYVCYIFVLCRAAILFAL